MISEAAARYIWDARRAADTIARFTTGYDFAGYMSHAMLRSATERLFTIVGEALVILRRIEPDTAARVPDLARAVGLRNFIVHRYWRVEHDRVWDVVVHDLNPFRGSLQQLLEEHTGHE